MLANVITPRQLDTLRWYARRPRLWRQFLRMLSEKRRGAAPPTATLEAERREGLAWAETHALSAAEVLDRITGDETLCLLEAECPEEVAAGHAQQQACPAHMGGGADYHFLYTLAERLHCVRAIETGVAFGWSSFALLHSLAKRGGRLISTDMPYPLRENDAFVGCVVPSRLRRHWTLLRAPDRDALPTALRRLAPIDLCHYDSDKSTAGRRWAYPRLWRALRPGGLFVTDDVQDNLGFAEFCASVGLAPLVARVRDGAGFKFAGILLKPGN